MEQNITVQGKDNIVVQGEEFKPFLDQQALSNIIEALAEQINRDYAEKDPIFLVVLNGSFMFASDLLKRIKSSCRVSFVKMASYNGKKTTGSVKELIGINEDLEGQHVVILEDIIDTGITINQLLNIINEKNPASVRVCTMFFKPKKFQKDYEIHYIGKEISNEFIIGYGLDLNGYVRNLPIVYQHV
ncbi:MAG: hypoxanthine phosphoribosyltransferase [Bacteroidales bacterium]|jgi:hypoxanthine phosphoribosyltransferase|nr:hypoxanthine phosphoribosyltransferase [Bacteroidales bacterium]